jgi:probable rRNA maturation factor
MEKAVRATFAAENPVVSGEVNIILISDQEIKKLNRKYRKVNRITDVISFRFSPDPVTGDIYISEGRSKKQAKAQGHGWEKELTYLTVHGILHLFNYTDYTPKARATMFRKQDAIWAGLFK